MLRSNYLMICVVAAVISSRASAECVSPPVATVPDGARATSDEMVEAQSLVKQFMAEMELYLACLDQEESALSETPTDEQKAVHTQLHNKTVDSMETVATKFNEQVRVFKKENP